MSKQLSNYELFELFYNAVKESDDIVEIIRDWGGGSVYIPSFKTTHRNEEIRQKYKNGTSVKHLQREYGLSANQIYNIVNNSQEK